MCSVTQNRTKIVVGNPLKADPTRTTQLRLRFEQLLRGKFNKLRRAIFRLIVEEDVFGIKRKTSILSNKSFVYADDASGKDIPFLLTKKYILGNFGSFFGAITTNQPGRWQFKTTSEQVTLFEGWLQEQIDEGILDGKSGKTKSDGYWRAFSEDGYRRGAGRAFDDVRKPALSTGRDVSDFFDGTRDEFLRQSFARPVSIDKLKLLAGRVFTDLQGVTTAMSTQLSRQLVDGLATGAGPAAIARDMLNADGPLQQVGTRRATQIARTEIIRAHAEGQLDAFENLGVTEIGVMAEFSTSGDDRVCPLCEALEGIVMTIPEARGLIPRHVTCRCSYIPSNVGESTKGQVRGQKSVQRAIDDSIRAEIPKGRILKSGARRFQNPKTGQGAFTFATKRTLAQQKSRSSWIGADRTISKKRPRAVVKPLGKPSVAKPRLKPPVKPPVKPSDATSDFVKGSEYKSDVFIVRNPEHEFRVIPESINFFGDGVYVTVANTPENEATKFYLRQAVDKKAKVVIAKVRVKRMHTFDLDSLGYSRGNQLNGIKLDRLIENAPIAVKNRYDLALKETKERLGLQFAIQVPEDLKIRMAHQAFIDEGYDALRIKQAQFTPKVGGDQIVVFDARNVRTTKVLDLQPPFLVTPKPPRQEDVASFSAKLKKLKPETERTIPPTNLLGEPGFDRFIVGTETQRDGLTLTQRIVVFDAEATVTGKGAFKKSIAKLKKQGLPIRMDNVQTAQFREGLERLGFTRSGDSMIWNPKKL